MLRLLCLVLVCGACSHDGMAILPGGVTPPDDGVLADAGSLSDARPPTDSALVADGGFVDEDGDGLDDHEEARIAYKYLPFLSIDPKDGCALAGILYRLRPHPSAPDTHLHMIVDIIYQRDCGALGHVGDDEVFGVTIDPSRPPPAGLVALRAIAHQNTACQHISDCGSCMGMSACSTATRLGISYPVVYSSKNKHGNYLDVASCNGACLLANYCTLAPLPPELPMVNVGEPDKPLTRDLTTNGFITAKNGWTEATLQHFDPWGNKKIGGAGNVTADLIDNAFLTPVCK